MDDIFSWSNLNSATNFLRGENEVEDFYRPVRTKKKLF